METWKDIKDFEGLYLISSNGNVFNINTQKTLRPFKDKGGYLEVDLYNKGNKTRLKVHRIVAGAFIENTEKKPCINHIDGIRSNNCVSNLEWCTHSENNKHSYDNGNKTSFFKKGEQNKTRIKKVVQFDIDGKFISEYPSVKTASVTTGVNKASISLCANNKTKQAGGFVWRYFD